MNIINQQPPRGPEYDFVAVLTQREDQQRLAGWFREIGLPKQATRVEACCDRAQLAIMPNGERKAWLINHCHVRGCTHCGQRRAFKLAKTYAPKATELVAAGHQAQLMTLTIPNANQLTKDGLKGLMSGFNKLRRQSLFKKVKASVASLEVEHGAAGWHPHLHALVIGERIRQWDLIDAWARLSEGHIADCRPVNQADSASVIHYITKPFKAQDSAELKEYLSATAKMQMARATGAFRGRKAETAWPEKGSSEMRVVGVVNSIDPVIADFLAGVYDPGRAARAWVN